MVDIPKTKQKIIISNPGLLITVSPPHSHYCLSVATASFKNIHAIPQTHCEVARNWSDTCDHGPKSSYKHNIIKLYKERVTFYHVTCTICNWYLAHIRFKQLYEIWPCSKKWLFCPTTPDLPIGTCDITDVLVFNMPCSFCTQIQDGLLHAATFYDLDTILLIIVH